MLFICLGKLGYLKEASVETMAMSSSGMEVSVTLPLMKPLTRKSPLVSTPSRLERYVFGMTARKFLKSESGVSNVRSISVPSSISWTKPSNLRGSSLM